VNDVVLAAVTAGFRDLLTGRAELVDGQVVRSLVPVSVRAQAERGTLNNRVSAVLVNLPVGEADPERRLFQIRQQMDDIKNTRQAVGAEALTELAGFAAPTLLALGSRLTFRFPQPVMQTATNQRSGTARPAVHVRPADGGDPSVRADRKQHSDRHRYLPRTSISSTSGSTPTSTRYPTSAC
jgi:hypothetical protein